MLFLKLNKNNLPHLLILQKVTKMMLLRVITYPSKDYQRSEQDTSRSTQSNVSLHWCKA